MKVCFFGLGSIGRRHLKNLSQICRRRGLPLEVHAVRGTRRPLHEEVRDLVHQEFADLPPEGQTYDAVFIANPTSMHFQTIQAASRISKCFFVEKPVFQNTNVDLDELSLPGENRYYVAAPLRYTNVLQYLNEFCRREKVISVRAICSSYLPDWRPGVDYRTVYSARKELGGGVAIDLIHEWDYLTWLFGFPEEIKAMRGKTSALEIDTDDIAVYLGRYPDKIVELHLDYFGRENIRQIQLFLNGATVTGDLLNGTISFSDGRAPVCFREEANDRYLREMEHFLSFAENEAQASDNSLDHALAVMKVALASDQKGRQ